MTAPINTTTAPQPSQPTAPQATSVGADVPPPSTKLKIHHVTIGRSLLLLLTILGASACSKGARSPESLDQGQAARTVISQATGPTLNADSIPEGQSRWVTLSNGAEIPVQNQQGTLVFQAHGTFSAAAFTQLQVNLSDLNETEKNARIRAEIQKIFKKLATVKATGLRIYEKAGYFRFQAPYSSDLLKGLAKLNLKGLLLNPIAPDREALARLQDVTPGALGFEARTRSTTPVGYSGLERMGALEFVKLAESDIGGGIRVDGSSVKVGITDTGITYNHPTFRSRKLPARNRIDGMRDFTREGRIYFHPSARFEVQPGSDANHLVVTAEVIPPTRLPNTPSAEKLALVEKLEISVSTELQDLLLAQNGSSARLGILSEEILSSSYEQVDLNANGKVDDQIPVILIPGATPDSDRLYVNFKADGDFRKVNALRDFNSSGQTTPVFAERIGFEIQDDELSPSDGGDPVAVKSASIVGFDPGNHGSHVAGIAAGIQTLSNDSSDTLARGVAPEARLFSGRVCSNTAGCDATEAFVDLVTHAGVDVVNMSLGGLNPFNDGYGVEETLINRLVETGKAQFMISAGNSGPGKQTVGSPSIAARALSIGATATRTMIEAQYEWPGLGATRGNELPATDDDFMLFFSSRGPTAAGGFKPNLTAPGTELSSVQLNAAPGARGGLDVYWGTSMAAPAATGAYALLLDGVRKYNAAHPESSLPSDSLSLREALVESARGFNVKTYHPATGASRDGRTTWIDQGAGMIDLPATWKKLRAMRDVRRAGPEGTVLDAVTLHGAPVELEYNVVYNQDLSPNPLRYDGSRLREGVPTFGTGAFVDFHAENTLLPVYITRRLPSSLADQPEYGELVSQLLTTRDEFELEVEIHGSNVEWLKAGSLQQNPCWDAETSNLSLIGRAAEVIVNEEEQGEIVAFGASALNLCVNREKISRELQPGDHGALVRAYRRLPMVDAEGRITTYRKSPTASFIVPVHLVVPARTLDGESAFVVESTAASFEVSRNYITIPEGVSALRVTLEVPELKRDSKGRVLPGQSCSGVELTSMEGQNVVESFPKSADARIMNCGVDGRALADKSRRLELVRQNPTPGIWDLHIMGLYRFRSSNYRMRVDYVTGESSVKSIAGVAGALSGSLTWKKIASSMDIQVSAEKSALELAALEDRFTAPISQDENLLLEGALGTLRVYPPEVGSVVIRTGGAAGSDIDLLLVRCDFIAQDLNDPSCEMAGSSAGGTATEMLKFEPDAGHAYAILVQGYSIVGQKTDFDASESLTLRSGREVVPLTVSGHDDGSFLVQYAFGPNEVTLSTLARFPLFTQGRWKIGGAVQIRNSDGLVIDSIPVTLSQPVQE